MSLHVQLTVSRRVHQRVLDAVKHAGDLEVGGSLVGRSVDDVVPPRAEVLDFIPAGPSPEDASDVSFLADRSFQLWTFKQLLDLDPDLEVIGMWHSHIPNGLDTFSDIDHLSAESKLTNLTHRPGFLSALIWTMPEDEQACEDALRFAFYPTGKGARGWGWIDAENIDVVEDEPPEAWPSLMDLHDHEAFFRATGRRPPSGVQWLKAIEWLANTSPMADHDVLIDEEAGEVLQVEPTSEGPYFLHLAGRRARTSMREEPNDHHPWLPAAEASAQFHSNLLEVQALPTDWHHLNPNFALHSERQDVESLPMSSVPWYRRWFRRWGR